MTPPPYPRATVRLQFNAGFRFRDAEALVPYFAALGLSHVYASPFLMARSGSTHGYDIVDHNRFNPEIGDEADFTAFTDTLKAHGMGLIMDFVPNHMGIGAADNDWWLDVLEWGQHSPYADFFDIDWQTAEPTLKGKVLLPVLGNPYGTVLEQGELPLRFDREHGTFDAWYYEHRFPIAVRDYGDLLEEACRLSPEARDALRPMIDTFRTTGRAGGSAHEQAVRRRDAHEAKLHLAALVRDSQSVARGVDGMLQQVNGTPGNPKSFDRLHKLLERQAYRVAYWRVAAYEINYRRFFDINDLAALRMENAKLFQLAHELVFRLVAQQQVQGVRLDHVDGLLDPGAYCTQLQDRAGYALLHATAAHELEDTPATTPTHARLPLPLYVTVEKILARHERLREDWPVCGTTGYEFMNQVLGLFVDPAGQKPLSGFYERFTGLTDSFEHVVVRAKRLIMRTTLASELNVLANRFNRLAKQSRVSRDYALPALRSALTEVAAHFPVYRTYVTGQTCTEEDRRDIDWAVARARKRWTGQDHSIFDFIHDVLTTELGRSQKRSWRRSDIVRVAMRWQQFTGPVTAKAMEDTAFYRYVPLACLNEVGGEPDRFGVRPGNWHQSNRQTLANHPFCQIATATHDHKRGEDVRTRLAVLSERPREWGRLVRRWARLNASKRRDLDEDRRSPSPNDEYLFYQSLVGIWPPGFDPADEPARQDLEDRLVGYMLKAAREAKVYTAWTAMDEDYENALETFVRGVLSPRRSRAFLGDLGRFVAEIAPAGIVNSLGQVVLKLTAPGVPDFYQGTEFWDFSLVDPDNRRPVDWAARQEALDALDQGPCAEEAERLLHGWPDGRIKHMITHRLLAFRRRHPDLFARGLYQGLEATGPQAERVVAHQRRDGDVWLLAVVPRLVWNLMTDDGLPRVTGWEDTTLSLPEDRPPGPLTDLLTGRVLTPDAEGHLPLAQVLTPLPVACLVATPVPPQAPREVSHD